jgi:Transmembrane domain of unknown function (DUF3566)
MDHEFGDERGKVVRFSKLGIVTDGDPGAPKASPAVRAKNRATSATREPKVTASTGGAGSRRTPRATTSKVDNTDDDVLARLALLDTALPADDPTLDPVLPTIVEADPSYPPVSRGAVDPSNGRSFDDVVGDATPAQGAAAVEESPVVRVDSPVPIPVVLAADAVAHIAPDALTSDVVELDALALAPGGLVPGAVVVTPQPTEAIPTVSGDGTAGVALPQRPLRSPMVFMRAKPRVRRVTRVIRHVDTWSVFKVAIVFNAILYLVCLTSGVLLWNVAHATGTVDNVEKFFEQFGWESFQFKGGEIYHNAWIAGLFVAVGLTGFAVLLATLFNLITDLVGGVRVSVLEEEVVARSRATDQPDREQFAAPDQRRRAE